MILKKKYYFVMAMIGFKAAHFLGGLQALILNLSKQLVLLVRLLLDFLKQMK